MKLFTRITLLLTAATATFTLAACGDDTYTIGASPTPHSEMLAQAQDALSEDGIEFDIVEFNDYVQPNTALDEGELDANFFQHIQYLEGQIDEHGYAFTSVHEVHIEPIGLYTQTYDSLDELPEALEIIVSNSPSDRPRLLQVLEDNDLLTINDDVSSSDIVDANVNDLPELFDSEHTIEFTEIDPPQLYTNYANESGDLVLINGNFAMDNDLNPLEDALAIESTDVPFVNVLVTSEGQEDDPVLEAIIDYFQTEEFQTWMEETYDGAVIPAD